MLRLCLIALTAQLAHAATQGPRRCPEQDDDTAVMLAFGAVPFGGDQTLRDRSSKPCSVEIKDPDTTTNPPEPEDDPWGKWNDAATAGGALVANAIGGKWGDAFSSAATVACVFGGPAGALLGTSFSLIGGLMKNNQPDPLVGIKQGLDTIAKGISSINEKLDALKEVIDVISANVFRILQNSDQQLLHAYLGPFNEVHGVFQYTLGIMQFATDAPDKSDAARVQMNNYRTILRDQMIQYLPFDQTYQKMNLDSVSCFMKFALNLNENNERQGRCTAAMAYQHIMSTRAELTHLQVSYWGLQCHQCDQDSQSTYWIDKTDPNYAEVNASVIRMIDDMQGYAHILQDFKLTNLTKMNQSSLQSMMAHGDEYPDLKLGWPEALGDVPKSFFQNSIDANTYVSMVKGGVPEGYRPLSGSGGSYKDKWDQLAHSRLTINGHPDNNPHGLLVLVKSFPNPFVMDQASGQQRFPVTIFVNDCVPLDTNPPGQCVL